MCFNINKILFFIILLINLKYLKTFDVNFYYNYNLQVESFNTEIHKRDLQQSADKQDSFHFMGFEHVESIPIAFPIDICVLHLEGVKYASSLYKGKNGVRHFGMFKMKNNTYEQIADIAKPNAISLDCHEFEQKGYIAIVNNITENILYAEESSVIYEIAGDLLRPVQYFTTNNLLSMYLYNIGSDFLMLQHFSSRKSINNFLCSYFKLSGNQFSELGGLDCKDARYLETFTLGGESYVAISSYDPEKENGNSQIYKFNQKIQQYELFQKISEEAVDVRYFEMVVNKSMKSHFLIFTKAMRKNSKPPTEENMKAEKSSETQSVIYVFENDKFVPYQELAMCATKKILPVQSIEDGSCILLALCGNHHLKIYTFVKDQFRESKVQVSTGAMSSGITNMRAYQEQEKTYLVISNKLMFGNEANVFCPVYKKDTRLNSLRKEIMEWADMESKHLQRIDLNELNSKVEKKVQSLKDYKFKRELADAYINTITTESLVYPKLKMSSNYWKALYYINQALDILEEDLTQKQRSKRNTNSENQYDNLEYVYEILNIDTLTINQNLKAKMVNKVISANPEFNEINATKVVVNEIYKKPLKARSLENLDFQQDNEMLNIRNLQINGKLNEYSWDDLLNNTLKRKADIQFIKAPVEIENLETQRTVVTSNEVNGQHLGALIPIDSGEFVINQDIQFAEPVTAQNVEINERLNNVHVFKGKFDVLLKRANETQIIEGVKKLNNVKVLEPISIAGRVLGRQLESITPNKAIHEPLMLTGDFMINGDIDINQSLKAADIIDLREKLSLKHTLSNGIRMDKKLQDVKLKFLQPLMANNSVVSFVNQNDLQKLVKLNLDEIQIIEGEKKFMGSLEIRQGFSEVKNLNGVDIEKLKKNSFLRNTNQTIKVPMKFGRIQAASVNSSSILLNNRNLTDYLTKSGNQTIKGNLIVQNLHANSLNVDNLITNNRIFQQNLQDIYQQKSRNAPTQDIFVKDQKFHGSIYIQNLILNSTINDRNIEEIEKNLIQLEGNIKYVGNFKFNYPMNVTQLTFHGKVNDINSEDLGKCWLQKKGQQQQDFIGAHTVARLNAEKGMHLQGRLNNFTMEDFYSKTYWISRDEYLKVARFENPIEISSNLNTYTLNHHYVPEEILCHNDSQQLLHGLTINGDLEVEENHLNVSIINNINIQSLRNYLNGDYSDILFVENAHFEQGPPLYKTLNHHSIAKTLDTVWLINENVILPQHIEIDEAYFEGLLEFEGLINNMNFEFLKENYFSKTKPQNVSTEMIFSEDVVCKDNVAAKDVQFFGSIVETKSGLPLDFVRFVENTLKTSGPHLISANWSILEAIIAGDLNRVLVNDLNLVDDIVHNINNNGHAGHAQYVINAPKRFRDISIANLIARPLSTINNVPVANWIKDAVYLYENYTIYGTTTMQSLNVFNDLKVFQLNNITFNEHSLLLQDREQILPGNLRVVSYLADEKRFLTNNIENLHGDFINSENVPALLDNLLAYDMNVEIPSHVIFKQPLKVEKYEGPEGLITEKRWFKRAVREKNMDTDVSNLDVDMKTAEVYDGLEVYLRKNVIEDTFYAVDHFEIKQTFNSSLSEVFDICLATATDLIDLMVVIENGTNDVTFYKWMPETELFIESEDFNWLPSNALLLSIIHKMYKQSNEPISVDYLKTFIANLKNFPIPNNHNVNTIQFINESCLLTYKTKMTSDQFQINCLGFKQQPSKTIVGKAFSNIQEVLTMNPTTLAITTNNSQEIWKIDELKAIQKLAIVNSKQMTYIQFKSMNYLAVITAASENSLNYGSIEIYRSNNGSDFELWQTLHSSHSIKIEFSYILESQDLLLYVLNGLADKPLIVYQYSGIMGFQPILEESNLPAFGLNVKAFNMKSSAQHMIGLIGSNELTIVEIVLRKM